MRVVVTGATGFIGHALVDALRARGDQVVVLARDAARAKQQLGDIEAITADLENQGPWWDALNGTDAIIHLAGESLSGKRWDARQKQKIRDSRVESTRTIVEAIEKAEPRPRVLITASGVDYYPSALSDSEWDDDEY
ncbi:MAG TPA: NAD-dependent epimerase/dehydratase family protein, partial [Kofleriaceae bacterium]|nr:NAD-dependent epimerase/dehydratase family protein [Kofleriaceae bacterium]